MTKKKYQIKPRHSMWGILALLTIGLGIACLAGAPISPWWILAPIGIPLGLMIAVPLYFVLALVLLGLVVIALVVIGIVPCILLALVLGVKESIDDKSWLDF